jgi:endonuclease YncB( thermonuclease family)
MDTISKRNKRKMQRLFTSCSRIWSSCDTTKVVSNGEEEDDQQQQQLQKPSKIGNVYDIRPPTPPRKRPQTNDNERATTTTSAPKWKDTIPFVPPIEEAFVIKVYDGDTITVAASLPHDPKKILYRFSVRLDGIDSPEIKGKTQQERDAARTSQHVLETLILNKKITLENRKTEKYGRILATVYCRELGIKTSINQWMLDNSHAVPYDGGTKKKFDEGDSL